MCAASLFEGAVAHSDVEMVDLLVSRNIQTILPTQDDTQEAAVSEPRMLTHDAHPAHPIVSRLRQTCSAEFNNGVCSFALADKVCPRKLLRCLVQHSQQLSVPCTAQARAEIVEVVKEQNAHNLFSLIAWILLLVSACMCCRVCVSCFRRCCCASSYETVPVDDAAMPSAPPSEEAELEMALVLSAAEAKGAKVVDGIPVIATAHDQV
eukprot:TRINITY_DN5922_c0_g1_i2.p2 TRINITY_DN5922_c0_g1~~TRINITY_DN5922_c0_g1_i2.p2  ORF type:complete len:208 (-),score=41.89 TRINITY_DN5922_c0_g1_i2:231-854(-)